MKIIGALFKIPLANILGETGNADFNNAYNIYAVLLTISTAGLPVALSKMISEAIRDAVVAAGDERMDALADYWSTKANLPYVNIVFNLSGLFAQVSMAKNVGKLTAKLLNKGISMQLEAFKNSYFNVKL